MTNKEKASLFTRAKNKISDMLGEKQGVSGDEENALLRDPKPYSSFTTNGIFSGYDGSTWIYFKFPDDVQVYWNEKKDERLLNQMFLTHIFDDIGQYINDVDGTTTKKDQRVRFHIAGVREISKNIMTPTITTPAQKDYIERMGGFTHSEWHFYLGLELQVGSIFSDVYGIKEQMQHYVDFITSRSDVNYELYKESLSLYNSVCLKHAMKPLDFYVNNEDFERLTAWFGQSHSYYGVRRELATTPLIVPKTGMSIIAGDKEMSFLAVSPKESQDMFTVNPLDETEVEFGREFFAPDNNVVHINIRGAIRSPGAAQRVFDDKLTKGEAREDSDKKESYGDASGKARRADEMERNAIASMEAGKLNASWLYDTEVIVAVEIDGEPLKLSNNLSPYGLRATNILHRQDVALASTVPCYPNPIFRVNRGNGKRNPNVNSFYSGVLSASGMFRSTRLSSDNGILLGLSSEGHEYRPIYTDLDDSKKHGAPPIILITGDTGSGKALPLSTRIPSPQGWTTMGELQVGDTIYGPDGQPTTVTYITPVQKNHEIFALRYDGQREIRADANHQWIIHDPHMTEDVKKSIVEQVSRAEKNCPEEYIHVTDLGKYCRVRDMGWTSSDAVQASLEFVDVYPDGNGYYRSFDVFKGLRLRVHQCLYSSVPWRVNDNVVRRTTKEMFLSDRYRFRIPCTVPVELPVLTSRIDPFFAGYIVSCEVNDVACYIKSVYGTFDRDTNEQYNNYLMDVMKKYGINAVENDYGHLLVGSDGIGVIRELLHDRGVFESITSTEDRAGFIAGIVYGFGYNHHGDDVVHVTNIPEYIYSTVVNIITSMGMHVEHVHDASIPDTLCFDFVPYALTQKDDYHVITSIERTQTEDVQCIQVDNGTHSYLVEDYLPTSNTVEMLQMVAQTVYLGRPAIMINPKPKSSAKKFFDLLGGITINMSAEYLQKHPGQLDPLFYIKDREHAGRILAEMIISAMKMNYNQENRTQAAVNMEMLTAEIVERARMKANQCSWDIIMGNKHATPPTPEITNTDVIDFIHSKIATSPFWKASISRDPNGRSVFKNSIQSDKPILIEWDGSIVLPDREDTPDKYTPAKMDGVQSILNIFEFSREILSGNRSGGVLYVDEAFHFTKSSAVMNQIITSGREWRSSGATLVLATQEVLDFLNPEKVDISSYIRLFIFMAIKKESKRNLERFLDVVGIEDRERVEEFIVNARRTPKSPYPGAFIKDNTTAWSGGIVCGPFPSREMKAVEAAGDLGEDSRRVHRVENRDVTDEELRKEIRDEEKRTRSISG